VARFNVIKSILWIAVLIAIILCALYFMAHLLVGRFTWLDT